MNCICRLVAVLACVFLISCTTAPGQPTQGDDQSRTGAGDLETTGDKLTIRAGKIVDAENKSMVGKPVLVLSKADLLVLDGLWTETAKTAVKSSQVPVMQQSYTLRILGAMVLAKQDAKDICASFDLRSISKIERTSLPADVAEQARRQVGIPAYAELWVVNACNYETRWMMIGAEALPYISSAPAGV